MTIRTAIGYIIACGLITSAIRLGGPFETFFDPATAALLFGGTAGLLITLLKGLSFKHITWLGMPATIFSCVTGFSIVMIGTITLLRNLQDPSSIGPSMAVCLLGTFYTLVFMALVSNPLEDWYHIKQNRFHEVTLSRVAWFLFPIASIFFALIAMSLLMFSIQSLPGAS